jgi:hypothetical protein
LEATLAKIVSETLIVTVSKLVKDDSTEAILAADFSENLEAMVTELLADRTVLVEVVPVDPE